MKKKGNKKMPRPRQEIIDNPIPIYIFVYELCNCFVVYGYWGCNFKNACECVYSYTIEKQRCRDRVINDFLSRSRHLLVPLLFHELTSLHPPSFQRKDFSTCSTFLFRAKPSLVPRPPKKGRRPGTHCRGTCAHAQ